MKSDTTKHRQPVETQNVRAVKNAVRNAVNSNAMVSVVAEIGSGKTTLFNYLSEFWNKYPHRFRVVTVKGFDMRVSRISAIMRLLVETINPDAVIPRQIERLYTQLTEELRAFCSTASHRVILMIDEAQDMNMQTFRDIKKIHEIDGNGEDHLLSVVLFGKPHRKWDMLFASPELGYRVQCVLLEKLTTDELVRIAEERYGLTFENNKVRERFAASVRFKTPLGVEYFSRALRKELNLSDNEPTCVSAELVNRIPMLSLKIRAKQAGVTQAEIVKHANSVIAYKKINPQRVSEFLNGKIDDENLNHELTLVAEEVINRKLSGQRKQAIGEI